MWTQQDMNINHQNINTVVYSIKTPVTYILTYMYIHTYIHTYILYCVNNICNICFVMIFNVSFYLQSLFSFYLPIPCSYYDTWNHLIRFIQVSVSIPDFFPKSLKWIFLFFFRLFVFVSFSVAVMTRGAGWGLRSCSEWIYWGRWFGESGKTDIFSKFEFR